MLAAELGMLSCLRWSGGSRGKGSGLEVSLKNGEEEGRVVDAKGQSRHCGHKQLEMQNSRSLGSFWPFSAGIEKNNNNNH